MPWLIPIALAAGGAAAGAEKDRAQSDTNFGQTSTVGLRNFDDINKGASGLENATYQGSLASYNDFAQLVGQGPGSNEIGAASDANNQYASMLQGFMQNGGMPNQAQMGYAQQFAQSIYDPQRVALQQSFVTQNQQAKALQAKLGRGGYDPVLQNKLALGQTNALAQLNSQQGALSAQTAMNLPQQQMQYGQALTSLRNNLAQQALQNRSTLMSMGQSLMQGERDYRLQTANRTNYGQSMTKTSSGGGFKGAMGGLIGGLGAGMGAMGGFSGGSGVASGGATGGGGGMQAMGGW